MRWPNRCKASPRAWPNHRYIGGWVVDRPPIAVDDNLSTPEDTPLQIDARANDSDPDPGSLLSIVSVGAAQHGSVTFNSQLIHYNPAPDYNGTDVFTYMISDGSLLERAGHSEGYRHARRRSAPRP